MLACAFSPDAAPLEDELGVLDPPPQAATHTDGTTAAAKSSRDERKLNTGHYLRLASVAGMIADA
jgi:hypothetical protein